MFLKDMRMAYLLDFYEDALDKHTANVIKAYYNDDLSLAEIAADIGISRQGIRHLVKKGEEQLEFYESKFGLVKRHEELMGACESLNQLLDKIKNNPDFKDESKRLSEVIAIIMKGKDN